VRRSQRLECTALNARIVVNEEFKHLEGKYLGPIEIFSENFSEETDEYHGNVNHIIRCLNQDLRRGPPEENCRVLPLGCVIR
jgi:hypothetical protein